ncbi:MAG TPA: TRAP transporter large permease subunit [Syntrophorhabdaceae bacterium]|nr:TRAP transporter large permease subunit [Syntrophorhabdaceae bacterium]
MGNDVSQTSMAKGGEKNISRRPLTSLVTAMGHLGSWAFVAVAIIIVVEVIARPLGKSQIWVEETAMYTTIVAAFFMFAYTLQEKGHVRVDFISAHLSKRSDFILGIYNNLLSLVFCGVLVWTGIDMVKSSRLMGEGSVMLQLPLWVFQSCLPLSAFLMLLVILKFLKDDILINRHEQEIRAPEGASGFRYYIPTLLFAAGLAAGCYLLTVNVPLGLLVLFIATLFSGMPVSFAMGLFGVVGLYVFSGGSYKLLMNSPATGFSALNSQVVIAFPLFFLSGTILSAGKLGPRIFHFANSLVRHLPGGIGVASIVFCGIFAAMTGSSVAVAAAISSIALPEMLKRGYSRTTTIGLLAAGGTLGILFPPSVGLIFYSALTGESISKMFMAAVLPGILLCLMFIGYIMMVGARDKNIERDKRANFKEVVQALREASGGLIVILIIIGGIYSGFFTVTEAGAVAVLYSIFLTVFWYKTMTLRELRDCVLKAAKMGGMLNLIIVAANIAAILITMSRVTQDLIGWTQTMAMPSWIFIVFIMVLMIVLGGPLEAVSIMVICCPILYPIIRSLGYDGVWFGVAMVINTELAIISPPEGMNLFVLQQMTGGTSTEVWRSVMPYLAIMAAFLAIVLLWSPLTLWLPSVVK